MSDDLLMQRLKELCANDLKTLIVGGLRLPESKVHGVEHADLVTLCSVELRAAAGSSTVNLTRDSHAFPYKQLLIDVADKLARGSTPLSWTKYRLKDEHTEEEIEQVVLDLFEEQARKWWQNLSEKKQEKFVDGINSVLLANLDIESTTSSVKPGAAPFLRQQALEQLIQTGLIAGLARASAGGLLGVVGVSVIGQLGWAILVQTLGWMTGLKIAIFGFGGYGALGGAVALLGGAAIGSVVALPGLVALVDGAAYRKTVPTTIMLLAKSRLDRITATKKY